MKTVGKMVLTLVALLSVAATASAATDKLIVNNGGGTPVFKVDDAGAVTSVSETTQGLTVTDTAGTGKAVITTQGYIGAGLTSPATAINVKGTTPADTQLLLVRKDANTNGGAGFIGYHNNITNASCTAVGIPSACCTGVGSGTCPTSTLPQTGDRLAYFLFGGYGANGTTPLNTAGITARTEGVWTESPYNLATYFSFETTATSTRTEKFRISGAGNIVAGNNGGAATVDLTATATDGFLYIPNVAGAHTACSTVKQYPGHTPIWFDSTNGKICTCQGATLKCATLN